MRDGARPAPRAGSGWRLDRRRRGFTPVGSSRQAEFRSPEPAPERFRPSRSGPLRRSAPSGWRSVGGRSWRGFDHRLRRGSLARGSSFSLRRGASRLLGAGLGSGFGSGFLAVSRMPLANSMTWPWWISQCKSAMTAVCSGVGWALSAGRGRRRLGSRRLARRRRGGEGASASTSWRRVHLAWALM